MRAVLSVAFDGVDVVLVRREELVHLVEPAAVHGQQLGGEDEPARRDRFFKPRHATPWARPCRA